MIYYIRREVKVFHVNTSAIPMIYCLTSGVACSLFYNNYSSTVVRMAEWFVINLGQGESA